VHEPLTTALLELWQLRFLGSEQVVRHAADLIERADGPGQGVEHHRVIVISS
jgi:hypothetical protein